MSLSALSSQGIVIIGHCHRRVLVLKRLTRVYALKRLLFSRLEEPMSCVLFALLDSKLTQKKIVRLEYPDDGPQANRQVCIRSLTNWPVSLQGLLWGTFLGLGPPEYILFFYRLYKKCIHSGDQVHEGQLRWHFRKLFQSSQLKAWTSLLPRFSGNRRSSFEYSALKKLWKTFQLCHRKVEFLSCNWVLKEIQKKNWDVPKKKSWHSGDDFE